MEKGDGEEEKKEGERESESNRGGSRGREKGREREGENEREMVWERERGGQGRNCFQTIKFNVLLLLTYRSD